MDPLPVPGVSIEYPIEVLVAVSCHSYSLQYGEIAPHKSNNMRGAISPYLKLCDRKKRETTASFCRCGQKCRVLYRVDFLGFFIRLEFAEAFDDACGVFWLLRLTQISGRNWTATSSPRGGGRGWSFAEFTFLQLRAGRGHTSHTFSGSVWRARSTAIVSGMADGWGERPKTL